MSLQRFLFLLFIGITSFWPAMVSGQEMSIDTARLRQYREEVAYMVSFLEFSFNTLGDPQTTTRQKETIFNESFLKVFRDADVQVEDDLVVGRSTVTNKDVQAYLKDIDFFFRTVHFDYEVEEITHEVNPDGGLYFKVKAQRHLEGIDLDGDTINNFQDRYIEVNLHPEMQELKIASIYTTRVSQEESLRQWWTQLSPAWKAVFGPDIRVNDSTTLAEVQAMNPTLGLGDTLRWLEPHTFWMSDSSLLSLFQPLYPHLRLGDTLVRVDTQTLPLSGPYLYQDLERLQAREALDLSGHPDLSDLSPLSVFSELKTLDLSETAARDLTPLRNLTRLEVLKLAGTQVADLSPLRYALGLREINLNQSPMADLRPVGHFPRLQRLYLAHTRVEDLAPLAGLTDLRDLDLRHTAVVDLEPLQACTRLEALKVDHTFVQTLDPLHGLESLHTLSCMHTPVYDLAPLRFTPSLRVLLCDHTRIQSLEPLEGLSLLRKVYCDSTRVDLAEANRFLARRPEVLVVYESETLQQWWQEMPPAWQAYFRQHVTLDRVPTREQLHEASSVQEVDLTGQAVIASAAPLRLLHRLESLTLNGTRIDSLGALSELTDLSYLSLRGIPVRSLAPLAFLNRLAFLDVAETQVADLEPLRDLVALEYLSVEKTPVSRLSPLEKLPLLRQVYADETGVVVAEVQAFLKAHPEALVVFQTASLRTWWEALSPAWQSAFNEAVGVGDTPSTEALHQLVSLPTLRIENRLDITRLDPLTRMLQLKTLDLIGTRAADLSPLATQTSLESLTLAQNPVTDLLPLSQLKKLRVLNIENTPVEDLEPIGMLYALEELWVSGTAVRNLKPLEGLTQLVRLDCSNTEVRSLKPLDTLMELKLLKCYNSKVSSRHLDRFKEIHPACEVVFY